MNKATFERALKAAAAGKPLKEIKVLDAGTGEVFEVKKVSFDFEAECIYIEVE